MDFTSFTGNLAVIDGFLWLLATKHGFNRNFDINKHPRYKSANNRALVLRYL
jgi:hypothetical protein